MRHKVAKLSKQSCTLLSVYFSPLDDVQQISIKLRGLQLGPKAAILKM